MNAIVSVLKPPGMTSHDVVNFIRRITGQKKVGHTGTLDPGAAGVLPVCIGKATKIIEFIPGEKRYRAQVTFGRSTTTQDVFGEIISESDTRDITACRVQECLQSFLGPVEQIPPMTSAVKYRGKKLYELARKGVSVERKPRTVYIYEIIMLDFYREPAGFPVAMLDIACSAGTYIRTLCHDLGEKLGCGAYMSFLLRTRAGFFTLQESVTLEDLQRKSEAGALEDVCLSMEKALMHLPCVRVAGEAVSAVSCGNRLILPVKSLEEAKSPLQVVRIEGPSGLLALARGRPMEGKPDLIVIQPDKVLV